MRIVPTSSVPLCRAVAAAIRRSGRANVEIAQAMGLPKSVVSKWTRNQEISLPQLIKLEKVLRLPAGYILQEAGLIPRGRSLEDTIDADPRLTPMCAKLAKAQIQTLVELSAEERGTASNAEAANSNARLLASAS